ncbi:MAG: amidohydrolase family protein [Dermatophilaceae bacterium]
MTEHPTPTYLRGRVVTAAAVIPGRRSARSTVTHLFNGMRPFTHRHPGPSPLGSQDVTVAGHVARLTEGGAIAGGTAHLLDVLRRTAAGGVPLLDAVRAAAATPAAVLGDPRVGALEIGRQADVVITDSDLRVIEVWRAGRIAHVGSNR